MLERNARKVVFDAVAQEYEAVRPGYPDRFIDELFAVAGIGKEGKVLEVGCGSGQATGSLVERVADLVCVDISPALLAIAEKKFGKNPRVQFVQTAFEEFDAPEESFDLVVAAASWHWVDPRIGYGKAAELLRPAGSLGVIATLHPRPFTGFFEHVQEIYRKIVPEWGEPNRTRTTADVIREAERKMKDSGYFRDVITTGHQWSVEYGRHDYLRLLTTYSDHYRLGPERQERLLEEIGELIDAEYGGSVIRPYETVGYVGRK